MTNILTTLSTYSGKTIRTITPSICPNGYINNIYIQFNDGTDINIHPQITFHGNDEYPAESELVIDYSTDIL